MDWYQFALHGNLKTVVLTKEFIGGKKPSLKCYDELGYVKR